MAAITSWSSVAYFVSHHAANLHITDDVFYSYYNHFHYTSAQLLLSGNIEKYNKLHKHTNIKCKKEFVFYSEKSNKASYCNPYYHLKKKK